MNYLISIEHPAWAHQFQLIIRQLLGSGHKVKVILLEKDKNKYLLDHYGLEYEIAGCGTGSTIVQKLILLLTYTYRYLLIAKKFKPDILFGRVSPMMSICSFLLGKQHYIFEDTDHSYVSLFFAKIFTSRIYTNTSFLMNLGKKQIRIPTYKELFYLHPDIFTPDKSILSDLDINKGEQCIVVRFVSWNADHDLGHKGFTNEEKIHIVKELNRFGKVFISSEAGLPSELKSFEFNLSPEKIHSLLYYSGFIFSESATMATEAAVLGTYAIYCDFKGRGYTYEIEEKYGLIFNFNLTQEGKEESLNKALSIASDKNSKQSALEKRKHLLSEKKNGSTLFYKELLKVL